MKKHESIERLATLAQELTNAAVAFSRGLEEIHHSGVENSWMCGDDKIDSLTLRNIRFTVRKCEDVVDDARSAMGLMD